MNLIEFLFAVTTVFGSTAVVTLWQYLMFKLDQDSKKEVDETMRVVRIKNK